MKRITIVFLLAFFMQVVSFAQSSSLKNPLYLGMILIDLPSVEKMESVCEHYDLTEEPEIDGYKVYRHSNGTEFRFRADKIAGKYLPKVIVVTKENQKSIDKMMHDAKYTKESGGYVKGTKYEMRRTKCKVSGGLRKTLTFEKEYNTL